MANAHDRIQDEIIARQVDLLRFSEGAAERVIRAVDSSEAAVVALIREELNRIGSVKSNAFRQSQQVKRLNAMLRDLRRIREATLVEAAGVARSELAALVDDEVEFIREAFGAAVQIEEVALLPPDAQSLRAATFGTPFGGRDGRQFAQWFKGLQDGDSARVMGAVRAGWFEGDPIERIVSRVRGVGGATQVTRNSTRTLVRTAVTAFSNAARAETFLENEQFILARQWVSTLDGRTSAICQSRDGKVGPVKEGGTIPASVKLPRLDPPNARPPAHPNCRSTLVPIIKPEGVVGNRPSVTDIRTRKKREVDFRKQARATGKPIQQIRREWAAERVGKVPAKTTYQEWLTRQPAKFQDELLGPSRGKLFRQGGLTVDNFVDRSGKKLTLRELKDRHQAAFRKSGVKVRN